MHFAPGSITLVVRNNSASLLVQENADPDVRADLERFFARVVPDDRLAAEVFGKDFVLNEKTGAFATCCACRCGLFLFKRARRPASRRGSWQAGCAQ